ncbi:hypothetical protein Droror1_Dr00016939 [Drosera rotundifolia]
MESSLHDSCNFKTTVSREGLLSVKDSPSKGCINKRKFRSVQTCPHVIFHVCPCHAEETPKVHRFKKESDVIVDLQGPKNRFRKISSRDQHWFLMSSKQLFMLSWSIGYIKEALSLFFGKCGQTACVFIASDDESFLLLRRASFSTSSLSKSHCCWL